MKIENKFVKGLAKARNPIPLIWEYILENIWQLEDNIKDYYALEEKMKEFESFLNKVYGELFTEILPKACINEGKKLDLKNPIILLDSLSIREAVLLCNKLEKENFDYDLSFSYSSLPSDTRFFKEKISYPELRKEHKTLELHNPEKISLDGDEELIWSDFPNARLERISAGRTVLDNVVDMYKECESILWKLIDQLEAKEMQVISDHGYTRAEAAYSFKTSQEDQRNLRKVMGGGRYRPMGEIDAKELVKGGYLIDFNGYYMGRARYTWTVGGKYKIIQHGGVSLLECLTPRLEIRQ